MKMFLISEAAPLRVCGNVYYEDYSGGNILVFYRTPQNIFGNPRPQNPPVFIQKVPSRYCLDIPRTVKEFYLCARCDSPGAPSDQPSLGQAYYVSGLIEPSRHEKQRSLDVHLRTRKLLMKEHPGDTVTISGNIMYRNYTKGIIAVAVETPENHSKIYWPPDIAWQSYPQLGQYQIEVPADQGPVFIHALIYPDYPEKFAGDMPGVLRISYEGNPLYIEQQDKGGVDFSFDGLEK